MNMTGPSLSVREIQERDIAPLTSYWLDADNDFLESLGVDTSKMLSKQDWELMLKEQIASAPADKKSYCIIWEMDQRPIGHSNINKIIPGQEAYMHLHIWDPEIRKRGFGMRFVRMTLPYFFSMYHLKTLYCEPYALNPAPNRTLEKLGFTLVREHVTVPGAINFEQPVKRWMLNYESFQKLMTTDNGSRAGL